MPMKRNETYVAEIKTILTEARQKACQAVNPAMVEAYWLIGKRIVEEEQNGKERAEYGEALLKNLSVALVAEFGKGFSYANLRSFRQFYLSYPDPEIGYARHSQLSWTHHRLIMSVVPPSARDYYLKETVEQHWRSRQLERNIHTLYYQRLLPSHNKEKALRHTDELDENTMPDFIKDPYVFEFLDIPKPTYTFVTEGILIQNLQQFSNVKSYY